MTLLDLRTVRVLTTICVFAAVLAFLYGVRHTLVLILFAVFFAYLVEPLVLRIENSPIGRHSRGLAILETYAICGGLIAILIVILGPRMAADSRRLSDTLPELIDKVTSGKIVWQFGSRHGWSYETQLRIEQFVAGHRETIVTWTSKIGREIALYLQNLVWLVLIPILAIFFLRDGRKIAESTIQIFGRGSQRNFLRGIAQDLDAMLASFIGAQLILAGISMVVYTIVFSIARLPYALVLGVAAGFMEFIPVVGPLIAAGVIFGIGFLTAYPHLLFVALFLGGWRVVQDYVVSPRVMGQKVELHPLAAIVAVLMGGELGGVLGVYLSIPAAATIRIVWVQWRRYALGKQEVEQARPMELTSTR